MKTNWNKVKQTYIEGELTTYPELAEKFKIGLYNLQHRAAKENWTEQRKLFQAKVENLRTEKRSEILASESAQFDSDCLKIARAALGKIVNELKGEVLADRSMAALEKAQKIGRLAMGERTSDDASKAEIIIKGVDAETRKLINEVIDGVGT